MERFACLPILWMLLGIHLTGYAQEDNTYFHVRMLRESDGLSNQLVTCLLQDQVGFLWVGTADGLNRYDGYQFRVFRHQKNDPSSLASNRVNCLYQEPAGVLWIGTDHGLSRLEPATGRFNSWLTDQQRPNTLSDPRVLAILRDHRGTLWVATASGLNRFEEKTGTFTRFYPGQAILHHAVKRARSNYVAALVEDSTSLLWLGTQEGLYRFEPTTGQFQSYRASAEEADNKANNLANNVTSLTTAGLHQLWVGTWSGGLQRFDTRSAERQTFWYNPDRRYTGSENLVLGVNPKSHLEWWVATAEQGLGIFHDSTQAFTFLPVDTSLQRLDRLPAKSILAVHRDRRGTYWVATGAGLARLEIHPPLFRYQPLPDAREQVWDVYHHPADGHWYLAIYGPHGWFYEFDPRQRQFVTHQFAHSPYNRWMAEPVRDQQGRLWLPTGGPDHPELWQFDPASKQLTRLEKHPLDTTRLAGVVFREVRPDGQGHLWLMSKNNGLFHYNTTTRRFRRVEYRPDDPGNAPLGPISSFLSNQRTNVCLDRQQNVWVAQRDGVKCLEVSTQRWRHYAFQPRDFFAPGTLEINVLAEDGAGCIWAGTVSHGLVRLDPRASGLPRLTSYTVTEGLPSNQVHDMAFDGKGVLWLATSNGLCRFEPRTGQMRTYTVEDGLRENNLAYGLSMSPEGTLFIGGQGGFFFCRPENLRPSASRFPLVWTSFRVLNEEVSPATSLNGRKELLLPYWQNLVSAEFAALSYGVAARMRYGYRLEGLERDWVMAGERRYASYANLSPGHYVLRIRASLLEDGQMVTEQAIGITILPPWWRTWWAYSGYCFLLLGGLLLARWEITRRERLRADLRIRQVESEKLRELDTMKSRFFANLSHEFRTPLALISGIVQQLTAQLTATAEQKADYHTIHRYANRLLQLINQLLDLSKLEAGQLKMHAQPGEVTGLLRVLAGSLESLAHSKGLTYHYALPLRPLWADFDADKLEKICTNLLSNAIKFTSSGGQVVFSANLEHPTKASCLLKLTVQDTGIGIPADHLPHVFDRFYQVDPSATRAFEGTGIGLALTKDLVELLGGSIQAESQVGDPGNRPGSTFTVLLPLAVLPPPPSQPPILNHRKQKPTWRPVTKPSPNSPPAIRSGCWWWRTTPTCASSSAAIWPKVSPSWRPPTGNKA